MFSRIMVGAALLATAFAGVLAAPAQAAPSTSGNVGVAAARYINLSATDPCYEGYFCAFTDINLAGPGVAFYATEANWNAIPSEFRWISNNARSGTNWGTPGPLDDVTAYPLPNFVNSSSYPAACIPSRLWNNNWGALRPESNRWSDSC